MALKQTKYTGVAAGIERNCKACPIAYMGAIKQRYRIRHTANDANCSSALDLGLAHK